MRYYWFAWDNAGDGLWDLNTGLITKPGTAYQQVHDWLVGVTPSGKCSQSGNLWTCDYTKSGAYQARAMWDPTQSCSNGKCTTKNQTVATQYIRYLDIAGGTHTISNHIVPVGAKPIFLVNQ